MAFAAPALFCSKSRLQNVYSLRMASTASTVDDYLRAAVIALPRAGPKPTLSDILVHDVTIAPGQLNVHYRIDVTRPVKLSYLAKVSRRGGRDAFAGEKASLAALDRVAPTGSLFVPQTLCTGTIDSGLKAYAIQPFISFAPFGSSIPSVQKTLGTALAHIHSTSAANQALHANRFGFDHTTYLGAVPQDNTWSKQGDWVGFFVQRRLRPRLDDALSRFSDYGTSNETSNALRELGDKIITEDSDVMKYLFDDISVRPSLLHGDLFMGNCGAIARTRQATVYDPASYYGHSECDLALSSMWGRFSHDFYDSYHDSMGTPAAKFDQRQELYRLYYLLTMLVTYGPGFGSRGDAVSPDGYFERCVDSLVKLNKMVTS